MISSGNASRTKKETAISLKIEKARRHLIDFSQFTFRGYKQAQHLALIDEKLAKIESGEIKRLIVTCPPRHGKSEKISIRFPAHHLGKYPDDRIIISSYAVELSRKFSKKVRDIMEDDKYQMVFPGVGLAADSKAANQWDLGGDHRGGLKAAGVNSGTTGWGADIFIVDDPVKDQKQAESKVYRESVWDWYQGVLETRLEPNAKIIVVMTRWHKDDLVGRLLEQQREAIATEAPTDKWEVVNLVALTETEEDVKNDPLGRGIGEALWPDRYPVEAHKKKQFSIGSRKWNAMFKGQPVDPKSQIVKREWIQYYDELPPDCRRAAGIDTATSKKTSADNMSMVDVCRDRMGFLYVDDVFLDKVSVSTFAHYISNQHKIKKYKSLGIEENAAGEAVKQRVEEVGRDESTYPPIYGFVTSTDKVIRVMEFQALVENGTVKWKRGHKKVADLIDHLVDFDGTGGSIDDDVDGLGFGIKAVAAPVIDAEDFASVGTDRDTAGGDTRVEQDWDEM